MQGNRRYFGGPFHAFRSDLSVHSTVADLLHDIFNLIMEHIVIIRAGAEYRRLRERHALWRE